MMYQRKLHRRETQRASRANDFPASMAGKMMRI
jgi:hypothetical protein